MIFIVVVVVVVIVVVLVKVVVALVTVVVVVVVVVVLLVVLVVVVVVYLSTLYDILDLRVTDRWRHCHWFSWLRYSCVSQFRHNLNKLP